MTKTGAAETFIEVSTDDIGERYGNLRLVNPGAYAAMERSIAQYGQVTPVVVGQPAGSKYEMVDGFKRYRACKKLGHKSLSCRVLKGKERALKSAMLYLNMQVSSIGDLEQGMIIQSFYKEDGLSQVEIAKLLSRHKSWVSRRLSLVDRLSDEVINQMRSLSRKMSHFCNLKKLKVHSLFSRSVLWTRTKDYLLRRANMAHSRK